MRHHLPGRKRPLARPARARRDETGRQVRAPPSRQALPHHPWQSGTSENTNGLLREYFLKGTDFSGDSDGEVERVYDAINRRPRKRLGFRTPYEAPSSEVLYLL